MSDETSLERPEDIGGPDGDVRRWLKEIELAEKREKDWKDAAKAVLERYRQKKAKKHSFNILYSNTETLLPAIYSKTPRPDVRRRFKDPDPVAKAASQMLERAITYSMDAGDWHEVFCSVVLDMLLPGRGVARVRYVPSLTEVGTPVENEEAENAGHEADEGLTEELDWQQVAVEHVLWDDFRHGPGRTWDEVGWVAFKHRLTRDELTDKFGEEIGKAVPLDNVEVDEKDKDDSEVSLFRTAEVWEVWCKEEKALYFVCKGYLDGFLKTEEDPLRLRNFFPVPRPLYAFVDPADLTPTTLYSTYREQAEELDRITARINRLVTALKARGVYDATLTEMSEVMRGEDNDFIALAGAQAMADRGGLDKAIWFMPIETIANVLRELYVQREQVKQVIYEITGISDILRGSTNASETATAQQIKNQWGTLRLQRLQRETQRFIRDLLRMSGEIIGQEFLPETLMEMTGVKLPSAIEQQQAQMAMQQQQMQAQQMAQQQPPGQPPAPPPDPKIQQILSTPSIDDVLKLLRSDLQREFRIDMETDSTIADSSADDMKGLSELMGAMGQTMQTMMPLVQGGSLPIDAVKGVLLSIARRGKLGMEVEDALDGMKEPQQHVDPKVQLEQQKVQAKQQADQQALDQKDRQHQMEMAAEQQSQQRQQDMEAQAEHMRRLDEQRTAEFEARLEQQRMAMEEAANERQAARDAEFMRWKATLEADVKVMVAQIGAKSSEVVAGISADASLQAAEKAADADATRKLSDG